MPFRHASSQKRGVSVPSRESVPASKFASVFRRNLALLAQDPTAANDGQATVDDGPLVFAPGQDVHVPSPHQLSSLASWREGECLCLSALSAANFIPDDESSSTTAQRPECAPLPVVTSSVPTDLPITDNHRSGNCCCAPFVETAPQALYLPQDVVEHAYVHTPLAKPPGSAKNFRASMASQLGFRYR